MIFARALALAALLVCGLAHAQSGYQSPDGKSRYPAVTIFCPNGTGVAPCSFGGGGGQGGAVSINLGGSPVSGTNRFPVTDPALDALIAGGALTVGFAAPQAVSVGNFPATQPVSASAWPLPAGAATAANQLSPQAPVAPGAATATASLLIGCLSNTPLPAFASGQQGAVPCDGSGRPYVVTVPSANNVPAYLQAVTSGGATAYRAINAANSTMAANVKASGGMVYGYEACNAGGAAAYLRLFALGTTPVPGSSVPQVSKLVAAGTCQNVSLATGVVFSSGIGLDVTSGGLADSDATAIATANQVSVEVYYK